MIIRDLFKEEIKGKSVTIKTLREKIAENVQLKDGDPKKILDKVRGCGVFLPPHNQSLWTFLTNKRHLNKEWRDLLTSIKTDLGKYRPKQQRQVMFFTYFYLWSLIGWELCVKKWSRHLYQSQSPRSRKFFKRKMGQSNSYKNPR